MSLYQILRILVSIGIAGAFFLLFRKKLRRKMLYIVAAVLLILSDIALCELPVENAFVTFDSPESAAQYVGIDHVSYIINGADTGLLISGETGNYQERIFPKAQDGWKLSGESATHIRGFYSGTDAAIQLLQYKDTAEYYLVVIYMGTPPALSDSNGSVFQLLQASDGYTTDSIFAAYVPQYGANYAVTINGETVYIS
jgi:hypothetical protein